jgi:phosphatidate cytidylyltransferase
MIWFLTMKRTPTTIPEIATTFTGMFYLGYVPSFWVRLRIMGSNREPTRLASIAGPVLRYLQRQGQSLPHFVPSAIHLPVTSGAIFIFWTWLCLDVGAYFVGRKFGRTKLGVISPAAAAASPNKTMEGLIGGCAVSAMLAIFGAWVQRWPFPILSGGVHGIILGLLGLIGDLPPTDRRRCMWHG